MANPTHRLVLLDHQTIVDRVKMREMKVQTILVNDETGVEEKYLSHTRIIADRSYTVKKSITDRRRRSEEMIETDMNDFELENFKNEWEENWNPTMATSMLPEKIRRFMKKERR